MAARVDADFDQLLQLPLHPLTRLIASGFDHDVVVMTNDGELPGILIPVGTDVDGLTSKLKPASEKSPGSQDLGYAKIARAAAEAMTIAEVDVWGSESIVKHGSCMHISYMASCVRGLKDVLEQVHKYASALQWGRGAVAATSGFAQSGADFILSDGDSWSGNIADAVFGLRPVIGMNNVKLMGYDLRYEESFSTGLKRIDTYFVPVDAPYSSAAEGSAQERKFLPQSAVMERTIKGIPIYTKHAPERSNLKWATDWYRKAMPSGVVSSYYKVKVTEVPEALKTNVKLTSWDPIVDGFSDNAALSAAVAEILPVDNVDETILYEGDFRMRVPQRLARSSVVLIEDPALEIIARSYDQLGTLVYGDEDPALARRGDEVMGKLIAGLDDKAQDAGDLKV
jgi:hypothetical protein